MKAFLNQALVAGLDSLNSDGSIHLLRVCFKYKENKVNRVLLPAEQGTKPLFGYGGLAASAERWRPSLSYS